jgi:hypothetical protein
MPPIEPPVMKLGAYSLYHGDGREDPRAAQLTRDVDGLLRLVVPGRMSPFARRTP